MKNNEFTKLISYNIKDKLHYVSNTVVIKHIEYEETNDIIVLALDYGKVYKPKPTTYSTFIQVIEGEAEVLVDKVFTYLKNGDSMIIPGNTVSVIKAHQRFKMLSIILKK
ncbi:cupin domain-containing protein [Tenacibaculum caenipelagi]|uniref:hypothetical protein n=1 Tax=Tenacibaculum caenipelagi TaxID=1325435 RepID=UPI00106089DE|nr:hypothetical protein [Tenacibaculum caenipelagi]